MHEPAPQANPGHELQKGGIYSISKADHCVDKEDHWSRYTYDYESLSCKYRIKNAHNSSSCDYFRNAIRPIRCPIKLITESSLAMVSKDE